MSRKIFTEEQQQLLRQNPYIYSVTDTRINLTKNSRRYFWQNINLVLLQEKSLKITVLTLVSSENAAYGASPITSVPNIKSTANFTKATGLVVYQLLMLPMTPVQKTTQMLTKSSNCNRK